MKKLSFGGDFLVRTGDVGILGRGSKLPVVFCVVYWAGRRARSDGDEGESRVLKGRESGEVSKVGGGGRRGKRSSHHTTKGTNFFKCGLRG